ALAGAVGSDEREPLALLHTRVDAVERPRCAKLHRQPAHLDDRGCRRGQVRVGCRLTRDAHTPTQGLRRRTIAKNGAPKNAVTTPSGSSAGDSTVRATTSASTRKAAPASSDSGT